MSFCVVEVKLGVSVLVNEGNAAMRRLVHLNHEQTENPGINLRWGCSIFTHTQRVYG